MPKTLKRKRTHTAVSQRYTAAPAAVTRTSANNVSFSTVTTTTTITMPTTLKKRPSTVSSSSSSSSSKPKKKGAVAGKKQTAKTKRLQTAAARRSTTSAAAALVNLASSSSSSDTTTARRSLSGTCVTAQVSPTGRSTCRACNRLIALGSNRFAKQVWSDRWEKFIFHYYHYQCFHPQNDGAAAAGSATTADTTAVAPPTRETRTAETAVITAASIKRETFATTAATITPPKGSGGGGNDKYEVSPNNLAKCTACRKRITKGSMRIGKEAFSERFNKSIHSYYHESCFPAQLRSHLHLQGGRTPAQELARQAREQAARDALLLERSQLREQLRQLRQVFARRLKCQPFLVWSETALDDLVVHMPTNKQSLLKSIKGMGPNKVKNFGDSMLQVIRQYRSSSNLTTTTTTAMTSRTAATITSSAVRINKKRVRGGQALASGTATSSSTALTRMRESYSRRQQQQHSGSGAAPRQQQQPEAQEVIVIDDDSNSDDHDHLLPSSTIFDDDDSDNDEVEDVEVQTSATLSCEEIVNQKFDHAAANGYMISIDD